MGEKGCDSFLVFVVIILNFLFRYLSRFELRVWQSRMSCWLSSFVMQKGQRISECIYLKFALHSTDLERRENKRKTSSLVKRGLVRYYFVLYMFNFRVRFLKFVEMFKCIIFHWKTLCSKLFLFSQSGVFWNYCFLFRN